MIIIIIELHFKSPPPPSETEKDILPSTSRAQWSGDQRSRPQKFASRCLQVALLSHDDGEPTVRLARPADLRPSRWTSGCLWGKTNTKKKTRHRRRSLCVFINPIARAHRGAFSVLKCLSFFLSFFDLSAPRFAFRKAVKLATR